jgi:hypothetical protein
MSTRETFIAPVTSLFRLDRAAVSLLLLLAGTVGQAKAEPAPIGIVSAPELTVGNNRHSEDVLPPFGTPRDLVFDRSGTRLYITTLEGRLWPYDLASRSLDSPYQLGGRLSGADIAPDGSYLLIAQWNVAGTQGLVHKLDLATGAVTNLTYNCAYGESGAWDVAVTSAGSALLTTTFNGSGNTPLRQINLATGAISIRADVPTNSPLGGISSFGQLHRSADGTRVYILEGHRVFTYSASTNLFGRLATVSQGATHAAVNRNGTLLGTRGPYYPASLETAPDLNFVRSLSPFDSGIAFDATGDIVYGVSTTTSQIIAYDTTTFLERFRFDVGEEFPFPSQTFGAGLLVASHDGRYLALNTGTGVRVYDLPAVQLVSVASVRVQGSTGYAIDLPLDDTRAVECRSGGPSGAYTLIFTFGESLAAVGSASVSRGSGAVLSSGIDNSDPRRYVVNLSGVKNAQRLKITLADVLDIRSNRTALISAQMSVLLGDTNGDRTVNAGDAVQPRSGSGEPVNTSNFRTDVNGDGRVNSGDSLLVRSRAGSSLP